jgi:O-antigen/teichoic acid export membrane protein
VFVGALAVLFSGLVAQLLHLRSSIPVALLGAVFVLGTLSHLQRGVVQGLQRFGMFGLGSAVEGIAKIAAALVILRWIWPSESGAVLALVAASACSLAFNGSVLHKLPDTTERVHPVEHPYRYSLHTLGTLVLLAMLLSTDVIAANRYLSSQAAGLYAAVSLSGKTVFFATSALTAFAFPVFSHRQDRGEDSRRALFGLLAVVVVACTAIVGIYFAAPTILVHAIFGSRYVEAARFVPWMAIAFASYSILYLAGMYLLSQRRTIGAGILGVFAVAQLAGFRFFHADIRQLIGVQLVVLSATAVVMTMAASLARQVSGETEDDGWQP